MSHRKIKNCAYCQQAAVKKTIVQKRVVGLCPQCLEVFRRLKMQAPWKLEHQVLRAEAERRAGGLYGCG